jgi:hypothetical protein
MVEGLRGTQADGRPDQFHGLGVVALLMGSDAQQVQGVSVPRFGDEDLAVELLRRGELPRLVKSDGVGQ